MSNLKLYFRLFLALSLFALASCAPAQTETLADGSAEHSESEENGHDDHHDDEDGDEHEDHDDDDEEHEDDHDDEHREHDAHEHGAAELSIALIDGQAEFLLETPAFNLVGFEYAPSSDEEKAAVDSAITTLEKGEWFALSDAAECTLEAVDVDSTMSEEDHEGEEHHDDDDEHEGEEESHSSFFATYTFKCASLENLASFDATALFSSFPNFEEIDAQWLDATQQSAATLSKDQPILSFE